MSKGRSLLLLLIAATSQLCYAVSTERNDGGVRRTLQHRFEGDISGACVLGSVIRDGNVKSASFCADGRDASALYSRTFEIGSITKTMTAFLVADLVRREKWTLQDKLADHLPAGTKVPAQGDRHIMVMDLLTHTSGLPALPPRMPVRSALDPYANVTPEYLLDALGRTELKGNIGQTFNYSNYGMMLMSLAVTSAYGGDLEQAFQEQLFKPLGMSNAFIAKSPVAAPAAGHFPGGKVVGPWQINPSLAGVGMVKATMADMEAFARANLGDAPDSIRAGLRLTHDPGAGLPPLNWSRTSIKGRSLLLHEGSTGGFSSLLLISPEDRSAVLVLSDTSLSEMGGLSDVGLALLTGNADSLKPRRRMPVPIQIAEAIQGSFLAGRTRFEVNRQEAGTVQLQVQGQPPLDLMFDSAGEFLSPDINATLTPFVLPDASINHLIWRQGGGATELIRETASRLPGVQFDRQYVGRYQISGTFFIEISEANGKLVVQGSGQPAITADATAPNTLVVPVVKAVLSFEPPAADVPAKLHLRQAGKEVTGLRVPDGRN